MDTLKTSLASCYQAELGLSFGKKICTVFLKYIPHASGRQYESKSFNEQRSGNTYVKIQRR